MHKVFLLFCADYDNHKLYGVYESEEDAIEMMNALNLVHKTEDYYVTENEVIAKRIKSN